MIKSIPNFHIMVETFLRKVRFLPIVHKDVANICHFFFQLSLSFLEKIVYDIGKRKIPDPGFDMEVRKWLRKD